MSSSLPRRASTKVVPQCFSRNGPRRNIRISSRPKAVTPTRRPRSASSSARPHRCAAAIAVCQPQPSSAAVSPIARPRPARRVACFAALVVILALGSAIASCRSVNVPTEQPASGQRQRRLAHRSRTGRPNAGRSASATRLDPCAHTGPPQPPQHGRPVSSTPISIRAPRRSATPLTATPGPRPTTNSNARVRSTATGILHDSEALTPPILGDPCLHHQHPHRPTPRANAKSPHPQI